MNAARKITDQITYVTIERGGQSHTYHKSPPPNSRLSTAWDWTLKQKNVKRISHASYCRLHALMMKHHVATAGKTMTCYIPRKFVAPVIELVTVSDDQQDSVSWWAA